MKLELEDSVLKRAWVAMAYDASSHNACWEFIEREDFDEPIFYLTSPGVYCVSGNDPATDRCRWLKIKDGKGEWREYAEIAHLFPTTASKKKLWKLA